MKKEDTRSKNSCLKKKLDIMGIILICAMSTSLYSKYENR